MEDEAYDPNPSAGDYALLRAQLAGDASEQRQQTEADPAEVSRDLESDAERLRRELRADLGGEMVQLQGDAVAMARGSEAPLWRPLPGDPGGGPIPKAGQGQGAAAGGAAPAGAQGVGRRSGGGAGSAGAGEGGGVDDDNVPVDYVCPITQEIMVDPVVAADGYSYERKAIAEWLDGHKVSPCTGLKLDHKHLIPNHALRGAIVAFQPQGTVVEACGALEGAFQETASSEQFLHQFIPGRPYAQAFTLLGEKFIVFHRSHCSVYGASRGKRAGMCVNSLSMGVLVTVFRKPNFAHTSIPAVERCCDKLRA